MERHYCTYCESKRNQDKMMSVYYPLLKKKFWHCLNCMSTSADISFSALIKKTKSIEIQTTEESGFSEMSGMLLEIEKVISGYPSNYKLEYKFK